jgi:DNA-binding MarR family transcriptional regulator
VPIESLSVPIYDLLERYVAASGRLTGAVARRLGLGERDIVALVHIGRDAELTAGASSLIRRLSEAGLVSRHPLAGDKRSVVVRRTPASARVEAALAPFLEGIEAVTSAFRQAERQDLEIFLMRAADLADQHAEHLITETEAAAVARLDLPEPVRWS